MNMLVIILRSLFLDTGHSLTKGITSYNPIEFWDRLSAEWHIAILKNEQESIRRRYCAVARTLVSDIIRITRQEAADMIDRSRRQLQRIVKRYREGYPIMNYPENHYFSNPLPVFQSSSLILFIKI